MAYVPITGKVGAGTGYVPIARSATPPAEPRDYRGTLGEIPFAPPLRTRTSTQAIPDETTGSGPIGATFSFTKDVGRMIARSIASAGITIASKIDPRVEELKPEDMPTFFGQALVETVFGKEPNKSIEQRIVEAEPKVKAWGEELKKLAKTQTLSARERIVVETLANLASNNPTSLAFTGIMGSVSLDLTPFGGLERNALKAFVRESTEEGAYQLLKRMGVEDDLARNFAPAVVKTATEQDARKLFASIAKVQETTKAAVKPYVPLSARAKTIAEGTPGVRVAEDATLGVGKSEVGRSAARVNTKLEKMAGESPSYDAFFERAGVTQEALDITAKKKGYVNAAEFYLKNKKIPAPAAVMRSTDATYYEKLAQEARDNLPPLPRISKERLSEATIAAKKELEEARIQLEMAREVLPEEMATGKQLQKFVSKREGEFLDMKDPNKAKTPAERERILARNKKIEDTVRFGGAKDYSEENLNISDAAREAIADYERAKKRFDLAEAAVNARMGEYKASKEAFAAAGKSDRVRGEPLPEATYAANRVQLEQQPSKIQRIKDGLTAARNSIGEGADKLLGTVSTRLKNIDPSLKRAIRNFEFNLANSMQRDRKAVAPFLKAIRSKNIELADYADLDLALKNGDIKKTHEVLSKYDLVEEFGEVRSTLDKLYQRAEDVGYDIGYETNYFPRMIADASGMLEFFQKGDDWSAIQAAIQAKETEVGRYLTTAEKANVINTLIRGYSAGKITLSKTGAMKARLVDVVDEKLNKYYRDSVESLLRYIDSTNEAIEARRFFGKGRKADEFANIDDSIGSYILNLMAEGKVKPSQETELRDILQARFAPKGTTWMTTYKNLSYIDTMGSFSSAITQIGDLAFALYKGGPIQSAKALGKAIVGKSEITRADIGIDKIAQEFQDTSRSARAVDRVFRLIGLHKMDALGKETVINSTIQRYRKLAENPTTRFLEKMEAVFGSDQEVISRVVDDLKTGKVTEDVKLLAFNELLDVQPVTLSEMPEQYLKGGNGRVFYMLKTYTIKLFDVYRNEVFSQIRTNPVQGIKNLLYLTGALVAMNATADEIKDLMLNRQTPLKDRVVDNILKLAGFSKFTIYKAREEGVGSAVAKTILPPFKFVDAAYKDVTQANEVSKLETIDSIPIAGKLYYWWFGKGAEKTEKKRKKNRSNGLPKLPALPKRPKLPKLPKLPRRN